MPELTIPEWEEFLSHYPEAHLLQTGAWGTLKSSFGWSARRLAVGIGQDRLPIGAQILFRNLPLGLSLAYIPKGPIVGGQGQLDWRAFWTEIDQLCIQLKAVFLKVEPDGWEMSTKDSNEVSTEDEAFQFGFRPGSQSVQPRRTLVVDLTGDEEHLLSQMKQKTRYNIRLALKRGVMVHASADLDAFHRLIQVTAGRDAFGVHNLVYYQHAYELFHPHGQCELFLAEYEGTTLGGIMVFARGTRAWYFYGASADEHRDLMPTYLLQWEAIRWARALGCTTYDLWGVPDVEEGNLEANFANRTGGLWGVYRFKRGFGGKLQRSLGSWDRVYRPIIYTLYRMRYWKRQSDS